ncbi:MAG: M48 family metalloprotease [Syntrophaceae bacterium]|nr:M48 family metalloprotease [Syntrophaceae bacterium]
MKRNLFASAVVAFLLPLFLAACAEVVQMGTAVGEGMGKISKQDREAIDRAAKQTAKAARPMTEQEEFYIGRAVAATILGRYPLYNNERLTAYVHSIGQSIALASDRPHTFGGYHFAILDSEEANALACPGGTIFITRGMLKRAQNEDQLAAILAHEVAHVNNKDGLASISKSRWMEALSILGSETVRKLGGAEMAKLVSLFEGSVDDVAKTLLVNGYSREQELQADLGALTFLNRLGYSPYGLTDSLEKMAREQTGGTKTGIFATHPGMNQRLDSSKATLAKNQWPRKNDPARDRRFRQIVG